MTQQWLILIGVYALFLSSLLVFGVIMNRMHPLWLRSVSDRFRSASRFQKARSLAGVGALLYLVMGAFEWLGASLGIPEFRLYRSPVIWLLMVLLGAIFVGLGSLLFVRAPNEDPRDWLADTRKGISTREP